MKFRRRRFIQHEILDDQSPQRAAPSLADIVRINRLLGGHEAIRKCLRSIVSPNERFSVLDVGAGSGDAAAVILKQYPNATVVSLDYRLHHVQVARGHRMIADAFRLPLKPRTFDVVYSGLFLHHFDETEVVQLLSGMAAVARRFVVVNDLERHIVPYYFLPATRWLFGWDPITLHDGPISVQAAFTEAELRQLGERAGLSMVHIQTLRPAFRIAMVAKVSDDKLRV